MTRAFDVYVLDPELAQIRAERIANKQTSSIRKIIGCCGVDFVDLDDGHTLYYDDEGLRQGVSHYTVLRDHADPLIGRLVVAPRGEAYALAMSIRQVAALFTVYRPVIDPVVKANRRSRGDVTSFISAVEGFTTRIERVDLRVMEQGC